MLKLILYITLAITAGSSEVQRVIISEASPICLDIERVLVAKVIQNRINNADFGLLKTAEGVIKQRRAFMSYSRHNSNWGYIDSPRADVKILLQLRALDKALKQGKKIWVPKKYENITFFLTAGTKPKRNMVHSSKKLVFCGSFGKLDFYNVENKEK